MHLDEIVIERVPPSRKAWETIGEPRLLVIGQYRMWFELRPLGAVTELRVGIDYELPRAGLSRLLGQLVGRFYAEWCTKQMVVQAHAAFELTGARLEFLT